MINNGTTPNVPREASFPGRCPAKSALLPEGSNTQCESQPDRRLVVGVIQRQGRLVPANVRSDNGSTEHVFSCCFPGTRTSTSTIFFVNDDATTNAEYVICSIGQTATAICSCFCDSVDRYLLSGGRRLRSTATKSCIVWWRKPRAQPKLSRDSWHGSATAASDTGGFKRSFCRIAKHEYGTSSYSFHAAATATIAADTTFIRHESQSEYG